MDGTPLGSSTVSAIGASVKELGVDCARVEVDGVPTVAHGPQDRPCAVHSVRKSVMVCAGVSQPPAAPTSRRRAMKPLHLVRHTRSRMCRLTFRDDQSNFDLMSDAATRRRPGRPPKVPREHGDTREGLLRCGMEVLTAQGMSSTGIDTVLKRVGVPKGSFYHYFASKDAFGLEVLNRYADYFARKLDRWFLEESQPPLERLARFVEDAKAGIVKYDFERGCLVGNLGQEVVALPDGYRIELEAVLRDWERRLAACLRLAVDAGALPADTDCDELASFFWIGWEGAVLRARLARDTRPLDVFLAGFLCSAHGRTEGA